MFVNEKFCYIKFFSFHSIHNGAKNIARFTEAFFYREAPLIGIGIEKNVI